MSAMDWIKARTTTKTDEPLTVEGVTYSVTREVFAGHLPRPMIRAAAKAPLVSTDLEHETLTVHAKSGFTEYSRTIYTPAAA